MKKTHLISILFITVLLTYSCSSDDDDNVTSPPDTAVTYTNTIKAIMDANCNNCHGDPTSNSAPMSLTTSALVENAITNRNLIVRVENGTMPPTGNLSASQIQSIKDWQAGGFK